MQKTTRIIHLALSFDENYLIPFYVLLTSIFHNNQNNIINVHVIATGLNEQEQLRIHKFAIQHAGSVRFYTIDQALINTFSVSNDPRFTIAVYYRLFFPRLIDNSIEKILYLDVDTIVLGDLFDLYECECNTTPISAGVDGGINPLLGIENHQDYFNSGVMLINLQKWENQNVTERAISFLSQYPEKALYHDQDALNVVLQDNWCRFDSKYNLTINHIPESWFDNIETCDVSSSENMDQSQLQANKTFLYDTVILHYNGTAKPWIAGIYHPFKYIYNDYFIKFSKTFPGKYLIPKSFSFQFSCLMIEVLKEISTDMGSKIFLSFILQITWLSSNNDFKLKGLQYNIEHCNNALGKMADYNLKNLLVTEFEKNKDLLNEIFYNIFFLDSASDYLEDNWLSKWVRTCKKEKKRSRKLTEYNELTYIPDLINKHLGITGQLELLPVYFISRLSTRYNLLINNLV